MKKIFFLVFIVACLNSLYADQAAWITKEQAEKGAALIRTSSEIRHFCAPCNDNFYRVEKISTVSAMKANGSSDSDSYYEVVVNGTGVDLAYVYILSGGKWLNAAMLLNIPVKGVPKILPSDLQNEEVEPYEGEIPDDNSDMGDMPLEEGQ